MDEMYQESTPKIIPDEMYDGYQTNKESRLMRMLNDWADNVNSKLTQIYGEAPEFIRNLFP